MKPVPKDDENIVLHFIRSKIENDWSYDKALLLGRDVTIPVLLNEVEFYQGVKVDEEQWRFLVKKAIDLNNQRVYFSKINEEYTVSQPEIRFPDATVNDVNGYWTDYRKVLESKLDPGSIENIRGISYNILKFA